MSIANNSRRPFIGTTFPEDTSIEELEFFDNYDLPCPMRVKLVRPDGTARTVVFRISRKQDPIFEGALLRCVTELGLPAPRVIAESPETRATVLELLSGENLQAFASRSEPNLHLAKGFLVEGISTLSALTKQVEEHPFSAQIPRIRLEDQFSRATEVGQQWSLVPVIEEAAEKLGRILERAEMPLVFTNGDYQPGNFLTDGQRVVGFVDFETACFQDPLIGLAKYPIYDLHPFNRAGLVEEFLEANAYSERVFAPRLALGCLMTLQKEIPATGGDAEIQEYRSRVLDLLAGAIANL